MSLREHRQPAPDFTDAFLCTLCLIVFMALCFVAAVFGYLWVAVTTGLMYRGIIWIDHRRS